jgi:hypothetical protein
MSLRRELIGSGLFATQADAVNGSNNLNVIAAGSTQATATLLQASTNVVTTVAAGAAGVILPVSDVGDEILVANTDSADTLSVYPPVGGRIGTAAVNTAVTQATNVNRTYRCISENGLNWVQF